MLERVAKVEVFKGDREVEQIEELMQVDASAALEYLFPKFFSDLQLGLNFLKLVSSFIF